LAIGNALVGNVPDAPALELCLVGPTIKAKVDVACIVFGAPFIMRVGGRPVSAGKSFTLPAGEELEINGTPAQMRGYLCVHGGLKTDTILGSSSSRAPLAAGVELGCVSAVTKARFIRPAPAWNTEPDILRCLEGGQAAWFETGEFFGPSFIVSSTSDRMGLRLQGPILAGAARQMTSEPVCPGTVQVTGDGQCIVLGVDAQTIGGYPKIAHVISADLDKLAQLRPGETVQFRRVSLQEAEAIYCKKRSELRDWLTRLQFHEVQQENLLLAPHDAGDKKEK
jgi:antagonist of KipI